MYSDCRARRWLQRGTYLEAPQAKPRHRYANIGADRPTGVSYDCAFKLPQTSPGAKMKLSGIELLAKAAEKACSAVINHPKDSAARERLFNTLADVVDPAFVETAPSRYGQLNDLLRHTSVWADIVRNRIDVFRHAKSGDGSASGIQYPARDLQRVLHALMVELGRTPPDQRGPSNR